MSGTTAQSLGIVTIIWGGTTLNVDAKSSSFSPGGMVSTPVVSGQQVTYGQQVMAPTVKASFPLTRGMSLFALRALNGTEMQVKCDSGQIYTVNGAFITKDMTAKGGAGNNVSLEWSGQPATEVVS